MTPELQGQDKVENPVAIPAQRYFRPAGLTDLGASASSLETDGLRGEGFRPSGTRPGAESPKQMVVGRSVKWRWCRALGSTMLRWALADLPEAVIHRPVGYGDLIRWAAPV